MDDQRLDLLFAALADSTRRAIIEQLMSGPATVNELARPFDVSLPAISRHLKVLERAGLISRTREAQWRPCRLEPNGLKVAAGWLEEYRNLWEGRLDRMERYLESTSEGGQGEGDQET